MRRTVSILLGFLAVGCKENAGARSRAPWEVPAASPRIEIALPEGAPELDSIESGTYVLAVSLKFEGEKEHNERQVCEVSVTGETIAILLEKAGVEPIRGTLKAGRLQARGREGEATYQLEGQVAGPGRLAGRLKGAVPGAARIREGRWELERVR